MLKQMNERTPSPGNNEYIVTQELLDGVRQDLIGELEHSLRFYGPDWVNKSNCEELIGKLRNKEPTIIQSPLWGDFVDATLHDMGIPNSGETRDTYFEIWRRIEAGE